MATNVERTLRQLSEGLAEEARENLGETRNRRTGNLYRSITPFVDGDDFGIEFLGYGVFLDQGTAYIEAKPWYSNLYVEGEAEGEYEEEIESMLEDAFDMDVQDLDEQLDARTR